MCYAGQQLRRASVFCVELHQPKVPVLTVIPGHDLALKTGFLAPMYLLHT